MNRLHNEIVKAFFLLLVILLVYLSYQNTLIAEGIHKDVKKITEMMETLTLTPPLDEAR